MWKKILKKIKNLNPFKKKITHYPTNKIHEMDIMLIITFKLQNLKDDYPYLYKWNESHVYWTNFVTSMCFAESDYNANMVYMEPAPLHYNSCGLLQLSHEDIPNYPLCDVDISGDLIFKPENNIGFGLHVLNIMLKIHNKPIMNKSFYWSVLNTNKAGYQKFKFKFDELQGWNK